MMRAIINTVRSEVQRFQSSSESYLTLAPLIRTPSSVLLVLSPAVFVGECTHQKPLTSNKSLHQLSFAL